MRIVKLSLLMPVLLAAGLSCTPDSGKEANKDNETKEANEEVSENDDAANENDDPAKEKAEAWISQHYEDPSDLKYETDDNGYLEVHFDSNGRKLRADFHQSGEWIETEESVDWDDLPQVVQDAIKAQFDKDEITELEWVDNKEKGKFYDVEFKQKGKNHDVMYREDGTVI